MLFAPERRSTVRIPTAALARVKNLTRNSEPEPALILDVSSAGMRFASSVIAIPGDALQIELPDTVLLAEAAYCSGSVIGVKLCHSLSRLILLKCVNPELWAV